MNGLVQHLALLSQGINSSRRRGALARKKQEAGSQKPEGIRQTAYFLLFASCSFFGSRPNPEVIHAH